MMLNNLNKVNFLIGNRAPRFFNLKNLLRDLLPRCLSRLNFRSIFLCCHPSMRPSSCKSRACGCKEPCPPPENLGLSLRAFKLAATGWGEISHMRRSAITALALLRHKTCLIACTAGRSHFGTRLPCPRADEPALLAEGAVLHSSGVTEEVTELGLHGFFSCRSARLALCHVDDGTPIGGQISQNW
jgi:hypothetical protein